MRYVVLIFFKIVLQTYKTFWFIAICFQLVALSHFRSSISFSGRPVISFITITAIPFCNMVFAISILPSINMREQPKVFNTQSPFPTNRLFLKLIRNEKHPRLKTQLQGTKERVTSLAPANN